MTSGLQIDCLDGLIYVHDLEVFAAVTTVQKSKGATIFEIDVQVFRYSKLCFFSCSCLIASILTSNFLPLRLQKETTQTGEIQHTLRLCVVVRRKLHFYVWGNRDFLELSVSVNSSYIYKQ